MQKYHVMFILLSLLFGCSQSKHNTRVTSIPCREKVGSNISDSLMDAIRNGDLPKVQFYIEQKNLPLSICDSKGHKTPLSAAVYFDQKEIFEYLIGKGANPSDRDQWGTAACVAALYGRDALLKRLLALGVDPNEKTNSGSPLLSFSVGEARYSTVQILLEHGADRNQLNEDGKRPIERAIRHKDHKMIDILNNYGKREY